MNILKNTPLQSPQKLLLATLATTLFGTHAASAAVQRVGLLIDESSSAGNDSSNTPTSRMPAGYVSTLGVPDESGTLFTGQLNGVGVSGTYSFSGGASWRIDPEIDDELGYYAYDNVPTASDLRLVPRLDVGSTTGTPTLDVTITFDEPVENLRMYMFWLDLSTLQFTGSNTIGINNSYVQDEIGNFSYDPSTRTVSDLFERSADETGRQVEDGGVGAEIDFNGGGPTSEISFRINDNSPNITASHDSIRYAFSTIPEPSSPFLLSLGAMIACGFRYRS